MKGDKNRVKLRGERDEKRTKKRMRMKRGEEKRERDEERMEKG
jgi:hypothetical protein